MKFRSFRSDANICRTLDTTGILQHNDINPQWHPTDVGQIKLASHMMQYLKLKFGLVFGATGYAFYFSPLYI